MVSRWRRRYPLRRVARPNAVFAAVIAFDLIKLCLQNTQKIRVLTALAIDTFLLPATCPIIEIYDKQLDDFKSAVKKYRAGKTGGMEGEPPGSPAPMLFMAILMGLAQADVGQLNKTKIQEQVESWTATSCPTSSGRT